MIVIGLCGTLVNNWPCTHILILSSNVSDTFHEVRGKRERKKEVCFSLCYESFLLHFKCCFRFFCLVIFVLDA